MSESSFPVTDRTLNRAVERAFKFLRTAGTNPRVFRAPMTHGGGLSPFEGSNRFWSLM
ncbi:MAG: hypothetical protein AAFS10_09965 [Myxococcota bacterium]